MSEKLKSDHNNQNGFKDAAGVDTRTKIVERHRSRPETWYEWLFRQLCLPGRGLPERCRVLELGSGPCDLWVDNWEGIQPGWEIFASDLSLGMVQEGARRICDCLSRKGTAGFDARGQFRFAVLDSERMPFESQAWDVVLAFGLLDLVDDVAEALRGIRQMLKPGGKFYTSAGGRHHLLELEALISPFLPELKFGGDASRFGLENGAKLLAGSFENITLARYRDEMVFRTVEPIVAFALSESAVERELTEEQRALLEMCLGRLLDERGEIRITAEKGVFSVNKPLS